ncbi:MAG: hypothetical protein IIA08_09250, partial [Proteobacteria bacterium]|nr:hypothetical protein [Pseudomonadota bacterium]
AVLELANSLPGAEVHEEYQVGPTPAFGAVDLFTLWKAHRIVVEIELTSRRVVWDIHKALGLDASHLFIVMPTAKAVIAARRRIRGAGPFRGPKTFSILPFGPGLRRIRDCFPLISNPILTGNQIPNRFNILWEVKR